jgi:hypothetical protein
MANYFSEKLHNGTPGRHYVTLTHHCQTSELARMRRLRSTRVIYGVV